MSRNDGLDLARAAAVLMVLCGHLASALVHGFWFRAFGMLATLGVEVFFSLSGFLIGLRLVALAERERPWVGVPRFLAARWLRTFPMYYAVLLYFAYRFKAWNPHEFLFVQTFYPKDLVYLAGGWSLSIEEFFYLFFPLLMCGACALSGRRGARAVAPLAVAAAVVCLSVRLASAAAGDWLAVVSYQQNALVRFDCTAYGVLAACVWHVAGERVQRWARGPGGRWALIGVALLTLQQVFANALFGTDPPVPNPHPYKMAVMFSVLTAAYALAVVALASRYPVVRGGLVPRFVARVSYSVYLLQFPFIAFLYPDLRAIFGAWGIVPMTAAVIGTAALTYYAIEAPFMRLRPRAAPGG